MTLNLFLFVFSRCITFSVRTQKKTKEKDKKKKGIAYVHQEGLRDIFLAVISLHVRVSHGSVFLLYVIHCVNKPLS